MDDEQPRLPERPWIHKFHDAFRGMKHGVRGQSSFFVHFFIATLVVAAGIVFRVTGTEWCILVVCIASVLAAEMFNSALESMAKAITHEPDPYLGGALDIGSAAVLITSIGAAVVGSIIFLNRLAMLVGWR